MKILAALICILSCVSLKLTGQINNEIIFFGDTILYQRPTIKDSMGFGQNVSIIQLRQYYNQLQNANYDTLINIIKNYKLQHNLGDWIYYQLIRRTAQSNFPKDKGYNSYTFFKWYLLARSGYNAQLSIFNDRLLLYVQSDDNIYDIPLFELAGKQYVCLNSHDFAKLNINDSSLKKIDLPTQGAYKSFSYKINSLPDFKDKHETQKELFFKYHKRMNCINITIDEQMDILFSNYPAVDFDVYFNIPISAKTYSTLIPTLKKKVKKLSQQKGVDYLVNFTRNAFMYKTDQTNFGKEKRLSPEQTLMNTYSDCDDRVALLYYLVKEIYDIPMLVILYPNHVVLAVHLQKNVGTTLLFKNKKYTYCEPTPQAINLPLGQLMPTYLKSEYKIGFQYSPIH